MSNERIWTDGVWAATWATPSQGEADLSPEERTARCYQLLEPRVFRTMVRDFPRISHADIEDAVQFAFLQYLQQLRADKQVKHDASWLMTVARNRLKNHIEQAKHWSADRSSELLHACVNTLTDNTTVDDLFTRAIKHERYGPAVETLPPFERRCFEARLSNLTLREIGVQEGADLRRVAEAIARAADHITRYINEA